jgi:hypothetical protein
MGGYGGEEPGGPCPPPPRQLKPPPPRNNFLKLIIKILKIKREMKYRTEYECGIRIRRYLSGLTSLFSKANCSNCLVLSSETVLAD